MKVLAIGAHPDDIELGCGGTLAAHRDAGHEVAMLVMTSGERGPTDMGSRVQEQEDSAELLGAELLWGGFQDGAIPEGRACVDVIQEAIAHIEPEVVYSHAPNDTHQDHRATAQGTISASRRLERLCLYEGPTTTEFRPSVYVDIADQVEPKIDALRAHVSQVLKNGLVDLEAIEALARHRGFQARIRQAEAFETDRFVWRPQAHTPNKQSLGGSATVGLLAEEY
jgi:LmbE family N-acetylglucosaminyl deacetylase